MVPARLAVPAALSIVGGYVDVICYIRYSTFVATMTGNLVITGQTFFEVVHDLTGLHNGNLPPAPEPIRAHIKGDVALALVAFRCMVMFFNCVGAFGYCMLHRRFPEATARTAAPWIALASLMPDLVSIVAFDHTHKSMLANTSVSFLAFALGFTHFMCSPAAEGSRLKAVTMATTGHMHGLTKLHFRLMSGEKLKKVDWDKYAVSFTVTLGMTFGAILGAAAMHLNPFGNETDDWLLAPVAITLFLALRAHDTYIPPPGGWPAAVGDTHATDRLATLREALVTAGQPC